MGTEENTHFLADEREVKLGGGREGSEMNEVEPRWSDCLNLSPKY